MALTLLLNFALVPVSLLGTVLSARYQRRHGNYGHRGYTVSWRRMAWLTVVITLMGVVFCAQDLYFAGGAPSHPSQVSQR